MADGGISVCSYGRCGLPERGSTRVWIQQYSDNLAATARKIAFGSSAKLSVHKEFALISPWKVAAPALPFGTLQSPFTGVFLRSLHPAWVDQPGQVVYP
jgi:hypothetical protein